MTCSSLVRAARPSSRAARTGGRVPMSEPTDHDPPAGPRRKRRERTATESALGLLTRREHSRRELARKLAARGHPADEVEAAVARLAEAGWQNDARFVDSLIRSRASGGYGPLHIRAELATHGIDRETIGRALAAAEIDWEAQARDLLRRRFGPAPPSEPALRRKAADLLLRRGFERAAVIRLTASGDWDDG